MTKEKTIKILREAATKKTTLRYYQVIEKNGLKYNRKNCFQLIKILMNIGDEQCKNGMPLLNALVVGKDGLPGDGFFGWLAAKKRIDVNLHNREELIQMAEKMIQDCFSFYLPPAA